jgi:5'-3' exoribonuclease 1
MVPAFRRHFLAFVTNASLQGVPKFYRWLSERYPTINQNIEDDSLLLEFDNLYLDLNGVIHNASHGNEGVTRKVADDVIARSCCATIDGIVKRMRPTQLIYMAIDGCAPRAKQNQQRARRTRAAKDRVEAREAAEQSGETIEDEDVFDSNCITPGTPFMDMINAAMLQFVIRCFHIPLPSKLTKLAQN